MGFSSLFGIYGNVSAAVCLAFAMMESATKSGSRDILSPVSAEVRLAIAVSNNGERNKVWE
jgi:hypothetical protein